MRTPSKATTCVIAVALMAFTPIASAQEQLTNGNLELYNGGGQPLAWTYVQGDSPLSNIQNTVGAFLSPYTFDYPLGAASAKFQDGPLANTSPSLAQSFALQTHVKFNFDFTPTGPLGSDHFWSVELLSNTAMPAFDLYVDRAYGLGTSFFALSDGNGQLPIIGLTAGHFYHVSTDVDLGTGLYSGSIQDNFGNFLAWTPRGILPGVTNLSQVLVQDVNLAGPNTTIYWDNFSIKTVPEPSSIVLAISGVGFFARRRILKKTH